MDILEIERALNDATETCTLHGHKQSAATLKQYAPELIRLLRASIPAAPVADAASSDSAS